MTFAHLLRTFFRILLRSVVGYIQYICTAPAVIADFFVALFCLPSIVLALLLLAPEVFQAAIEGIARLLRIPAGTYSWSSDIGGTITGTQILTWYGIVGVVLTIFSEAWYRISKRPIHWVNHNVLLVGFIVITLTFGSAALIWFRASGFAPLTFIFWAYVAVLLLNAIALGVGAVCASARRMVDALLG